MIPEVIFENEDVIFLNKPSGLLVHPNKQQEEFSVSAWAAEYHPPITGVGEPMHLDDGGVIHRHGIVHRLDKVTSGIMVIAKNQIAYTMLKDQFSKGEVKKEYCAFVFGRIQTQRGIITAPIGRDKNVGIRRATRKARGTLRDARTEFVVEEKSPLCSFVYFYPKTGRTHQIRIHAKHIRHPIVGDSLYAPNQEPILGFQRLALHSKNISLILPHTNIPFECSSAFPEDFKNAYIEMNKTKK